jgi:hypothetical protein
MAGFGTTFLDFQQYLAYSGISSMVVKEIAG